MTNAQEYFIGRIIDIGVQQLVFHGECEPHIDNRLNERHALWSQSGSGPGHTVDPTGICVLKM